MRPASYRKSYRQPMKAGIWRSGSLQGREHKFVVQCQIISPEIIYTSRIIKNKWVLFRNLCTYIYAFNNN